MNHTDAKTSATQAIESTQATVLTPTDSVALLEILDRRPSLQLLDAAFRYKSMMDSGGPHVRCEETEHPRT